jgi:circadian clock protein KaiC
MDEQVYTPDEETKMDIVENTGKKEEEVIGERAVGEEQDNSREKIEEEIKKNALKKENLSERVPTGINGFDELIEGGLERDSTVLLVGSAGTGKTIFSMQFLYKGATEFDEPGVFISFEEEKESIFKHALDFGWDFEKLESEGKFKLVFYKPHQVTKILEEGGGQIRDALNQIGAKRVVIDSITSYALLFSDEYKRREEVLAFFNLLGKWGITSIVIAEDNPEKVEKQEGSIGFISDAVISMYYNHDQERGLRIHSLEVLKMRGTKHTNKLCAINFEDDGINVYPDVEVF